MLLSDDQQSALDDVEKISQDLKNLRDIIEEQYLRDLAELKERQYTLAKRAFALGVPKRKIGLALGTTDHKTVNTILETVSRSPLPRGSVTVDKQDLTLSVTLDNWKGLTGTVIFDKVGSEWIVRGEEDLDFQVERLLFGSEADPELVKAVL